MGLTPGMVRGSEQLLVVRSTVDCRARGVCPSRGGTKRAVNALYGRAMGTVPGGKDETLWSAIIHTWSPGFEGQTINPLMLTEAKNGRTILMKSFILKHNWQKYLKEKCLS